MIPDILWLLIALQIAMGAFDMLFHHELTERLAWRPSQARELRLHGYRNLLYALLFAALGSLQVTGLFAWLVIAVLVAETVITLIDFVEEDRSRKLPASERVTHTLLALNYGAVLALLLPILIAWAEAPSGLAWSFHGYWSLFMLAASLGVMPFGVKDLAAARRLARLKPAAPDGLLRGLLPKSRLLVTGGTGFIGQRLIAALVAEGHAVTLLTRYPRKAADLPAPLTIVTDLDQIPNDARIDAVVNLAGQPIAGGLWTEAYKRALVRSRIETTRAVVSLIARLERKPRVLVSGSAIGVYGADVDTPTDETAAIHADGSFAQQLCIGWEAEAWHAAKQGVRVVLLRTGIVLDPAGGTLGSLLPAFDLGLGGRFGKGRHWMSWIARDDLVRLIGHSIAREEVVGPVNAVAPEPLRNGAFAKALGRALGRPAMLPLPSWFLTHALGGLGREIFLGSQCLVPEVALHSGFVFRATDIETALARMLRPRRPAGSRRLWLAWERVSKLCVW